MQEYKRLYPLFSLCGLNCGLCPRYHTEGSSKCPGCGGENFHLQHPACAVITCNKKHESVEYCFECSLFPCEKYKKSSATDSFISYKNVLADFNKAKTNLSTYQKVLNEKVKILEFLLANFNDGRRKNFYCVAVNLLTLEGLIKVVDTIKRETRTNTMDIKEKTKMTVSLLEELAKREGTSLELRK